MQKSPTLLMKELVAIEKEIARIHKDDLQNSVVVIGEDYKPLYASKYDFESNRAKVAELFALQGRIKSALNKFNVETKVEGFDLTIAEALVRIAQLRNESVVFTNLLERNEIISPSYREDVTKKTVYDFDKVKQAYAKINEELATLRVAVDTINLTAKIDY